MQAWREATTSAVLPRAETTAGREVESENTPELFSIEIHSNVIHFHVLYLYRRKTKGFPNKQLRHQELRRERNKWPSNKTMLNFLPRYR